MNTLKSNPIMRRNPKLPTAAFSILAAASFLSACNATGPCSQQFKSPDEVLACKVGAEVVAVQTADIKTADALCAEKFNITQLNPADPDWFDQATELADQYNACHWGASGRLVVELKQSQQTVIDEGCLESVGPGRIRICR